MKTKIFDKLPSTNDYAALVDEDEDFAIVANEQTGGKGTKGRTFSSKRGGLYLTLVKYDPCLAKDAFSIMATSCLAVARTLGEFGVDAKIKWANDVYVGEKKICGILIKNSFQGERVKKSIIGIGVNLNNELPGELRDIATTAKENLGKEVDRDNFLAALLKNLYEHYSIDEYRAKSMAIGRRIKVFEGETTYDAEAVGVADNGNLILSNGKILSYGEVSVKF